MNNSSGFSRFVYLIRNSTSDISGIHCNRKPDHYKRPILITSEHYKRRLLYMNMYAQYV